STLGRHLFLVPWREHAIFGTWESERPAAREDLADDSRDITAFIGELNQAFPALDLTPADITLVHRGIVPASVCGSRVSLASADSRRPPLGALGHPGEAALERAASIVAAELKWSEERRRSEIAAVNTFYASVSVRT